MTAPTFGKESSAIMKAVILAGGRGTRLQGVTHGAIPKPMAELLGRPILEHIIRLLAQNGFTDICCTLAWMPEAVRSYFGDGSRFGVRLRYSVEETPLGTAGAVKNCRDFFGRSPFLVISGDAACDFDLRALWEEHRRRRGAVTMALHAHDAPLPYGLVVTDARDRVHRFIEKPRWGRVVTDLVNTGIYCIEPGVMDMVPENTPCDFARDLFPRLLRAGYPLVGISAPGYWRDIGDPGSYYRANLDAWEGRLHLPAGGMPPLTPPETETPQPERIRSRYACRLYCPTERRARLMRELTAGLMEAGADFSDGLTLGKVPGGVHIAPCADREALFIESDSPDTARKFEALAKALRERI